VEGRLDENATLAQSKTSKRDKDGVFRHSQTMRLGTNWGTTRDADDGRLYEVKENDTFTWKQVPEAEGPRPPPRPLPPPDDEGDEEDDDNSTLPAGGEDDDEDVSSVVSSIPRSGRSVGSVGSVASSVSSRVVPLVPAPVRHEFMFDDAGVDVEEEPPRRYRRPPRVDRRPVRLRYPRPASPAIPEPFRELRELPPWNTRVRPPAPRFTVPDLSPRSLAAAQATAARAASARIRATRAHEAELDAMEARARAERAAPPGPRGRRRAPEGLAPPRGAVIDARRARAFRDASPAPAASGPRRSARARTPRLVSPELGGLTAYKTGNGWSPEQHDLVGSGFPTSY
jgi:hypothetical protein